MLDTLPWGVGFSTKNGFSAGPAAIEIQAGCSSYGLNYQRDVWVSEKNFPAGFMKN